MNMIRSTTGATETHFLTPELTGPLHGVARSSIVANTVVVVEGAWPALPCPHQPLGHRYRMGNFLAQPETLNGLPEKEGLSPDNKEKENKLGVNLASQGSAFQSLGAPLRRHFLRGWIKHGNEAWSGHGKDAFLCVLHLHSFCRV